MYAVTRTIHVKKFKNSFVLFIIITTFFFAVSAKAANEMDGNSFLEKCDVVAEIGSKGGVLQRLETNNFMYCMGYFSAIFDVYNNTVLRDNYKIVPYCLPIEITWKDIAEKVISFMKNHPDVLNQSANSIISEAIGEGFPCNNKPEKQK